MAKEEAKEEKSQRGRHAVFDWTQEIEKLVAIKTSTLGLVSSCGDAPTLRAHPLYYIATKVVW